VQLVLTDHSAKKLELTNAVPVRLAKLLLKIENLVSNVHLDQQVPAEFVQTVGLVSSQTKLKQPAFRATKASIALPVTSATHVFQELKLC
jgi:hypothetical protein